MLTSLPSAFPCVEIKGPVNPVEVGGQVEVVCNGSGAPPPEIRWMKDESHPKNKHNVHNYDYNKRHTLCTQLTNPNTHTLAHTHTHNAHTCMTHAHTHTLHICSGVGV